jgi:ribosomal protein L27
VLASTTLTTTADITAKALVGSFTANNKTYDGNNSATVAAYSLSGVIGSEVVAYSGGTATFDNKNVGMGKTVTLTGASLTGADAGNYTVNSTATSTANITALGVTGHSQPPTRCTTAPRTQLSSPGRLWAPISGDAVSLTGGTAAFGDKNVGTGKTVTLTGAAPFRYRRCELHARPGCYGNG